MQTICYRVHFTPKDHESISAYTETDVETAIKRALGIYNNLPIPLEVTVIDSNSNIILIINKY